MPGSIWDKFNTVEYASKDPVVGAWHNHYSTVYVYVDCMRAGHAGHVRIFMLSSSIRNRASLTSLRTTLVGLSTWAWMYGADGAAGTGAAGTLCPKPEGPDVDSCSLSKRLLCSSSPSLASRFEIRDCWAAILRSACDTCISRFFTSCSRAARFLLLSDYGARGRCWILLPQLFTGVRAMVVAGGTTVV